MMVFGGHTQLKITQGHTAKKQQRGNEARTRRRMQTTQTSLSRESVRGIGEYHGVSGVTDQAAQELAQDAEYRVRQVVQEALKHAAHAHRDARLVPADIAAALRTYHLDPLFGYGGSGASMSGAWQFQRAAQAGPARALFFLPDDAVALDAVIREPLPPHPNDIVMTQHWLAVEGVQPLIPQNPPPPSETTTAATAAQKPRQQTQDAAGPEVKAQVVHVLSKELQAFYETVTGALKSGTAATSAVVDVHLRALEHDPGTAQLLPYLVRFIGDEVAHNLRNLAVLTNLMRLAKLLVESSTLHIEPYLHQLMPPVLTCIIGKRLCADPSENHWRLREMAAQVAAVVCLRHGQTTIQARVTRTLLHAFLDITKPITTHFGAVAGLSAISLRAVALLIPNIPPYIELLAPVLSRGNVPTNVVEAEAKVTHQALIRACKVYLTGMTKLPQNATPEAALTKWKDPELIANFKIIYGVVGDMSLSFCAPTCQPPRELIIEAATAATSSASPSKPVKMDVSK
jgi:transcription initiation factor TFIID subunit 6